MPTRRRDLQGALGALLAVDVAQIGQGAARRRDGGLRPSHDLRALEVVGELDQRTRRQDVEVAARSGRLRPRRGRADQPEPAFMGGHRGGQHAGDGGDRPVEGEFAEHAVPGQGICRQGADGSHDGKRDGQS